MGVSDRQLNGAKIGKANVSSGSRSVLRQFEFATVFLPVKMAFHTADLGVYQLTPALWLLRYATPRLDEDTGQYQRFRVFEVALQKSRQLGQFGFTDQLLL